MVDSLFNSDGSSRLDKLQQLFDRDTINYICKISLTNRRLEDRLIWKGNTTGCHSVKSAYILEYWNNYISSAWWKHLWKSKIHERLKIFMWKLANHGLSTTSNLLSRNMNLDRIAYVHGCASVESECHVFFHCQVAQVIWFTMPWSIKWEAMTNKTFEEKLSLIASPSVLLPVHSSDQDNFFLYATILMEHLWKIRNSTLHDKISFSLDSTMAWFTHRFHEAKKAITNCNPRHVMPTVTKSSQVIQNFHKCIWIHSDAAVKEGQSTVGVITRNHLSEVQKIRTVHFESDTFQKWQKLMAFYNPYN
ncbi:uncharacterized protein LOC132804562 [Ziziphus jujuba]|uniref:Uncharacterized protein LOC132804562 n=1 Tax=Ziziphus jujuba TaxID=326968 RepID=A0ABM4AER3_ZIZJJ|nr:uncharacterized protein LOC132804562 [Ziziphus jujuba]